MKPAAKRSGSRERDALDSGAGRKSTAAELESERVAAAESTRKRPSRGGAPEEGRRARPAAPRRGRDHARVRRRGRARLPPPPERDRAAQASSSSRSRRPAPSSVDLARTSAQELSQRADALTVRAPADGVVYNLPRKVGESVDEGQLVASVADPERLRLRVRVDQPDLPRLAPGQRLVVTFDGLPDREWAGKVVQVSPGLRDVGGRLVAEVLGEIADPTAQLPLNASVNVRIVVAEKKGALVVPRAALQRDGERRYVWALSSGRARRRDVTIGLLAPDEVEIASGVSAGEKVLIPGMTPLTDGARVAAH